MMEAQLDLFAVRGFAPEPEAAQDLPRIDAAALDDAALIEALDQSCAADAVLLAEEAGRRRLSEAAPALEAMCRRLKGFGLRHPLREQTAALQALAALGGASAAAAVSRVIAERAVQGPGLLHALEAAAMLGCRLPAPLLSEWLRDADPAIRAVACRCVRGGQGLEPLLIELLNDLNAPVAPTAACALGRLGRPEARSVLLRLLASAPTAEAVRALAAIADEDGLVQLARLARARPDLRDAVLSALEEADHPRAESIAAALRRDARPA